MTIGHRKQLEKSLFIVENIMGFRRRNRKTDCVKMYYPKLRYAVDLLLGDIVCAA